LQRPALFDVGISIILIKYISVTTRIIRPRFTIMSSSIKKTLIALSISSALVAPSAFATNGYFAHGYSTVEKGMAGAGVAYSQDAMAVANNPAGIAGMGSRMDVGAGIFNPNRGYTVTGAPAVPTCTGPTDPLCGRFSLGEDSIDSDSDLFLIPHFGYVWQQDSETSIALGVYGNGGMNTNYAGGTASFYSPSPAPFGTSLPDQPGTFGAGGAGVNLSQLFFNLAYAKKIDADNSVGASLIFAYQKFKADGLGSFAGFSSSPSNLTNKSSDAATGFGVKLGWQGDVNKDVTIGVSYQSEIAMSEFDDYAGLFAEGGDFDIPATATIGLAWKTSDKSTLVFDIQQIYYEGVASISNPMSNLLTNCLDGSNNPTGAGCLGAADGAGFGWEDMTVIKLGYEWDQNDITWRVGLSNGDQPIPDSEVMFNILAPGVMETHVTGGFTMPITSDSEFSFAAMYAPSSSVTGANPLDPAQTIEIEMDQLEFQGTYTMKF